MRMAVRHQKSWPFASKVRGRSPIYFWPFASKVRGRSPPKFVAVRLQSSWPFATKVRGRSPSKFVAVRYQSSWPFAIKVRGRSPWHFIWPFTQNAGLERSGRSFGPDSYKEIVTNIDVAPLYITNIQWLSPTMSDSHNDIDNICSGWLQWLLLKLIFKEQGRSDSDSIS